MNPVWLDDQLWFPDPAGARSDGLVALGGDLSVERLSLAYSRGIFPWTVGPITWWSPDPRGIFELAGLRISRSLRRTLRSGKYTVTRDREFQAVMAACAAPEPGRKGTWISPEFITAYTRLHENGRAHSVECWLDGQLAGGIYGVSVGGLFAGESMFHRAADASKVALVHLFEHLCEQGFKLFDIQMVTGITARMGAVEISRAAYLERLCEAMKSSPAFQPR